MKDQTPLNEARRKLTVEALARCVRYQVEFCSPRGASPGSVVILVRDLQKLLDEFSSFSYEFEKMNF